MTQDVEPWPPHDHSRQRRQNQRPQEGETCVATGIPTARECGGGVRPDGKGSCPRTRSAKHGQMVMKTSSLVGLLGSTEPGLSPTEDPTTVGVNTSSVSDPRRGGEGVQSTPVSSLLSPSPSPSASLLTTRVHSSVCVCAHKFHAFHGQ